jgi:hypothetical protein
MQDQIKQVIHFGYQTLYTCWTFEEDWGIYVCPMDGNVSIEGCCPRGELIWAAVLYNMQCEGYFPWVTANTSK